MFVTEYEVRSRTYLESLRLVCFHYTPGATSIQTRNTVAWSASSKHGPGTRVPSHTSARIRGTCWDADLAGNRQASEKLAVI